MAKYPGIEMKALGTGIVQYQMNAGTALEIGLLAPEANGGAKWFSDWARMCPGDDLWVYTFGGIYGGFIYGEVANFETLADFAERADSIAQQIWAELQDAWFLATLN